MSKVVIKIKHACIHLEDPAKEEQKEEKPQEQRNPLSEILHFFNLGDEEKGKEKEASGESMSSILQRVSQQQEQRAIQQMNKLHNLYHGNFHPHDLGILTGSLVCPEKGNAIALAAIKSWEAGDTEGDEAKRFKTERGYRVAKKWEKTILEEMDNPSAEGTKE